MVSKLLGSDNTAEIKIHSAFRIEYKRHSNKRPRNILVRFVDLASKQGILDHYRKSGRTEIEGLEVQILHDLSAITLRKRRELKILTN